MRIIASVKFQYVKATLTFWNAYSVDSVITKHKTIIESDNFWCLNIGNFKIYLYNKELQVAKNVYKRISILSEIYIYFTT